MNNYNIWYLEEGERKCKPYRANSIEDAIRLFKLIPNQFDLEIISVELDFNIITNFTVRR